MMSIPEEEIHAAAGFRQPAEWIPGNAVGRCRSEITCRLHVADSFIEVGAQLRGLALQSQMGGMQGLCAADSK